MRQTVDRPRVRDGRFCTAIAMVFQFASEARQSRMTNVRLPLPHSAIEAERFQAAVDQVSSGQRAYSDIVQGNDGCEFRVRRT